jgi:flagellar secretion chaperone FliS
MNPQGAQNYLRTQVLTATPEQLQMMLYDGAIRFAEQARPALAARNWEASYNAISRAQKIITELTSSLRHDIAPELCGRLASIYNFIYRKLVEANVEHKTEALDEAIKILKFQRETWEMLLKQLGRQKAADAARKLDVPAPDARMEASICMQG